MNNPKIVMQAKNISKRYGQVTALDGADTVILAVPDTLISKVAGSIVHDLAPGTMVVILDAAAPHAGSGANGRF